MVAEITRFRIRKPSSESWCLINTDQALARWPSAFNLMKHVSFYSLLGLPAGALTAEFCSLC